jgi:hypothetical protein
MTKPHINFVHLCDSAFFSQEGKLNIIGMFKTIGAAKFPTNHPKMAIVLDVKVSESTKLKIQILKKETGETIAKLEGKLDRKDNVKGEKEMCFISDFNNVKFESSGEYRVEIWIGDELMEIIPFAVNKVGGAK